MSVDRLLGGAGVIFLTVGLVVGGTASGPLLVGALAMLFALAWRRGALGAGDGSVSSGDGSGGISGDDTSGTRHHGGHGHHGGGGFHGGGGHGG